MVQHVSQDAVHALLVVMLQLSVLTQNHCTTTGLLFSLVHDYTKLL
jgi:hypothetical protein